MGRKNYEASGYMTVEATLIMPLVLYICVFIIYAGFYQYDRCLMKQDAYRAALRGSSTYRNSNQEVYNAAFETLERIGKEKYAAASYTCDISVNRTVAVQMEGSVQMPFRAMSGLVGASRWEIKEKAESKCINPVFFIRTCRQLEKSVREQKKKEEEEADVADGIY